MFKNVYSNRRVLVIGHTGFKGSWLTLWLKKLGATVAGYANEIPTQPSLFETLNLSSEVNDFRKDIKDLSSLKEVLKNFSPEIVFHLAAKAIVKECLETPTDAFHTNLLGTVNVLEAIRECKSVRSAVIITSDKCYENLEWDFGYRETDRLGGKDPYSASKAAAEIAFSAYYRSYFKDMADKHIVTVRAGNVIGGGDWARDRIVPDCMRSWYKNQVVSIRSPNATRPWQHVLEPLSGYLLIGCWPFISGAVNFSGQSFNFGPAADVNKSVVQLINEMKKIWQDGQYFINQDKNEDINDTNININASINGNSSKEATLLKLCCDKALSKLSWMPTLRFEETVNFTAKWYSEFKEYPSNIKELTLNQIDEYQHLAKERGMSWTE